MLTYLLAFAMGLGSLALYLSAFFYPEVYRKGDLIWSGIGLFYALVLWVCAERITGGVLLGQMASISLIGWLGWQTFSARLGLSSELPSTANLQTGIALPEISALADRVLSPETTAKLKQQFNNVKDWAQALIATTQSKASSEAPPAKPYQPLQREDFGQPTVTVETSAQKTPEALSAKSNAPAETTSTTKPSIVSSVTESVKSIAISFQKPKKNTSTYVRKEFRDATPVAEDVDAEAFDFETDAPEVTPPESELTSIPVSEAMENAAIEETTITKMTMTEVTVTEMTVSEVPSDSMLPADEIVQEELEFEANRDDLEMAPHPAHSKTVQEELDSEASESEASEFDDVETVSPPVPPRPPRPDLVEAAIADAEAKHLPADPPETIEEASQDG
jgi:Ycf66 protein N-terminus